MQLSQFAFCLAYFSLGAFMLCGLCLSQESSALPLMTTLSLSSLTYLCTARLIPVIAKHMVKNDIYGYDINKKGSPFGEIKIPECIGFASAISFVIIAMISCLLMGILLNTASTPVLQNESNSTATTHWRESHIAFLATILGTFGNISGTILLGFADDMLDFAWRYKLIFPFIIVIPTLVNYSGPTHVEIPYPLSGVLEKIQLGPLFLLYIILLGIYCTNTINIYAGINGLEVGQSIVAASSALLLLAVRAWKSEGNRILDTGEWYSLYLLITFVGSALALLKVNQYPSKVFIGDTFCYFAGIVLCLAAITGNFAVSIHWFLFPQLINFLYSCPQLFGLYPCPRHRLTTYLKDQDKLEAKPENMNLLNLSLRIIGPTNQEALCKKLLLFQIGCSSIPICYEISI